MDESLSERIEREHKQLVISKRKGNKVRWRNKVTGRWEPGWWPLFVQVPRDECILGMTADEFNILSALEDWPSR